MPSDQQVDHVERAQQELSEAETRAAASPLPTAGHFAFAQAHASIAIAQELRGIREMLEGTLRVRVRPPMEEPPRKSQ